MSLFLPVLMMKYKAQECEAGFAAAVAPKAGEELRPLRIPHKPGIIALTQINKDAKTRKKINIAAGCVMIAVGVFLVTKT